tara:strand:+ start:103 stop:408 length:306 start_codon:yes stop_codon:yes gene_type:complete
MKKLALVFALLAVGLSSCKKDEETLFSGACNCGEVISDRVSDYSVVIKNNCSGRSKRWNLSSSDWMNAHPGSDYCITNTDNWRVGKDTLTREERVIIKNKN